MALDFPSTPTPGQIYDNYVYNADNGVWDIISFSDGIPAGVIMAWGASDAPANWLICDGAAVSRSTYASLFNAIGTTYGSGDGSTTFNLPDLRGRIPVGKNGGSFGTLGATGGTETVTLTESQMPSHTHIQNSHNHTQDAHNHTQNAHNHNFLYGGAEYGGWNAATGFGSFINFAVGNNAVGGTTIANRTATNNATTATNQATTATNQNTGGGQAHNNLQPYIVTNYIIKYSAANTPGDSELATRVGALETSTRPVGLGGTGATSLTSGGYLKGSGTSAITSQTGIPAGDINSGTLNAARLPSGTVIQQTHFTYNTYTNGSGTGWQDIHSGTRPSITAKRSDSHFIILASMNFLQEGTRRQVIRLKRDGTVISPSDIMIANNVSWTSGNMFYQWKDTSARTAGTTYTFSFDTAVSAGTWYYNYNFGGITGTSMYSVWEVVA
jgi:microcystin-dependent protein